MAFLFPVFIWVQERARQIPFLFEPRPSGLATSQYARDSNHRYPFAGDHSECMLIVRRAVQKGEY